MCTKQTNNVQNILDMFAQNYFNVIALNAMPASGAYKHYHQTMVTNIANESSNYNAKHNIAFQLAIHCYLSPLTNHSNLNEQDAPEQDFYTYDQLEWWTQLFHETDWLNDSISSCLMQYCTKNPYPIAPNLPESLYSYILLTKLIIGAGEVDHSSDWDPYIHFELNNGNTINTETGYEELELNYNGNIQFVKEANNEPIYDTIHITELKTIQLNYEG